MNTSKFRFTLDLHKTQSQISIPITLGDTARTWYISLSDGSLPYTIENGCLAKLEIKRPRGTHIEEFCPIEGNTTIAYHFSQNEATAAEDGIHECMIVLYDMDGYILGSPKFTMIVIDRVIGSDDIDLSNNDRTVIDAMIATEASRQTAESERQAAELKRDEAEQARATAEEARSRAEKDRGDGFAESMEAVAERVEEIKQELQGSINIDSSLSVPGASAEAKTTGDKIRVLEQDSKDIKSNINTIGNDIFKMKSDIADLLYEPIAITSFTVNPSTAEKGASVSQPFCSWKLNRKATTITLDGDGVSPELGSLSLMRYNIKENTTFTLVVTDERELTVTKTANLSFLNGVYYGVSSIPATMDGAFIRTLSKELRSNKKPSFTVNAGAGQYIWYCLPKAYGACSFTVGGFSGGFTLVDTISYQNAYGYTEDYYVYRSDNANLGSTSVTVG